MGSTRAEARGIYFPQRPETIGVWSFDGQDRDEVLGIRLSDGQFDVYIAAGLGDDERVEVLQALKAAP